MTPIGATVRNGADDDDDDDDDGWRDRVLSEEEAVALAEKLFAGMHSYSDEADGIASAVFRIVDLLTYERDPAARELSFQVITRAIYSRTGNSCEALTRFAEAAGARFGGVLY